MLKTIALIVSLMLLAAPAIADKQNRGTPAEAQAMVAKAIALFDKVGMKAAFDRFNNRPGADFKKGDLYMFVVDKADRNVLRIVAHVHDRSLIGTNAVAIIDPNGLNVGQAVLAKATTNGAWVDYRWEDPLTGKVAPKSSWVVLHNGYIFGCGIYKQ